jgi:TM2 domain-containing membrane protein YozV
MKLYHLRCNDEESGPFTKMQLQTMWRAGTITGNCTFRRDDEINWQPLTIAVRQLEANKSKAIYIILGLFFGCYGIHNFYAGRYIYAWIQLVLGLILTLEFPLNLVLYLWVLPELVVAMANGFDKYLQ